MLYASAQRQIQKAIEHIGVKPESRNLAVAIVAQEQKQIENQLNASVEYFGCAPDETVLQLTEPKMQKIKLAFQVTEQEMGTQKESAKKALVDLVIERMAILSTQF